MKIAISHFASHQTGLEVRTQQGKVYGTDLFTKAILQTLVGQHPGDTISELVIHRGTNKNQVLSGDLEDSVKEQILALLPEK